ncbi:MAG: hypothetical protein FVQ79_03745 [Planctomycetes bacterium]|nr:hypothetical protein [Planctomycetota bacterium]
METERLENILSCGKRHITIMGVMPIAEELLGLSDFLRDRLIREKSLQISFFYESENELFGQSLCLDNHHARKRMTYGTLKDMREFFKGIKRSVLEECPEDGLESVELRFVVQQINLRLPLDVICVDDTYYVCPVTADMPSLRDYKKIAKNDPWRRLIENYIMHYVEKDRGGIYMSDPEEELIELFDKDSIPRGIYPRRVFYNTEFQRYSVWGFIFNRAGQIIIHRRGPMAKDNPGLWDKSFGGHRELSESCTNLTARREMIEEIHMKGDYDTHYLRENLRHVVHLGDWRGTTDRVTLRDARRMYSHMKDWHWVFFHPTLDGLPMSVTRTSERLCLVKGKKTYKKTRFISDVSFFVSPRGLFDNAEQVKAAMKQLGTGGAASSRKLVTIGELRDLCREKRSGKSIVTDDLIWMMEEHRELLESFSFFVKSVFV